MKKKIYLTIISVLLFSAACEQLSLEREITTTLSQEDVNTIYSYTMNRATAMYTGLPDGFFQIDGAMVASMGDEAEFTPENSDVHMFNAGSWNAYENPDQAWTQYFHHIRNVNVFLENCDEVDLDAYKLDPTESAQVIYETRLATINNWKHEGRFLRAFYYFELIKRYGGVPILQSSLTLGDDYSSITRKSLSECVNFIVNECDAVAAVLPEYYDDADLGRATKGAALALKAKVLLYAASDLWNDASWASGYSQPSLISLTSGDRRARWAAAAEAAKAVIDLPEAGYMLADDYRGLFLGGESFRNAELILVKRNGSDNAFEKANYSVGFDLGRSGNTPTANLVDAYEVKVDENTAEPFNWNNPEHAANPYATDGNTARDPRLFMNVVVNNSEFKGRTMEIWPGGKDGPGQDLGTKTGYYLKKFVDEELDLLLGYTSTHSWPIIRLADVYLWYAEALNESNPGDPDIELYVNLVRQRTGVEMPAVPPGLPQDAMRNIIRHERMVELAFEGHRVWDLRRWMEAEAVLGANVKGVQITKTGDNSFNYQNVDVENRSFSQKMFFYPIPEQELLKMPNWIQNPLW